MKNTLITLLFFIIAKSASAQLSKIHFLPPIYAVNPAAATGNVKLFLSTPIDSLFSVKMYYGTSKVAFDSIKISSKASNSYDLGNNWDTKAVMGKLESLNTPIDSYGVRLESKLPFFANIRCKSGAHAMSLTSKGEAALGKIFRSGHMLIGPRINENAEISANFISVMATSNNTEITFSEFPKGVVFHNLPAEGKNAKQMTTQTHTVRLNKHQSYVIAEVSSEFHYGDENKSFGTLIESTKPIAVNIGSALGFSSFDNAVAGWDIGGDQIVPTEALGKEYVLIKGAGHNSMERPVVIAVNDKTIISVNGNQKLPLNAGDFLILEGHEYSEEDNMHIQSNQPIYVYQPISGSTSGVAGGLNFIPPLDDCVSANKINISSIDFLGKNNIINVITKENADVNFINSTNGELLELVNKNKSNLVESVKSDWVTIKYKVPTNVKDISVVSDEPINVSMTNNTPPIGAAGYFSGFIVPPIIIPEGGIAKYYRDGSLNLKLKLNGKFTSFKWFKDEKLIQETKKPKLQVSQPGNYYVLAKDAFCSKEIKSPVFTLNEPKKIEHEDVALLFDEEPENAIEEAILKDDVDPTILVNLNFKFDSEQLIEESIEPLNNIIQTLKKYMDIKIQIRAHTDCKGDADYNLKLSQRRADFVKTYMVEKGIATHRLEATGLGEIEPMKLANCDCDKNLCSEAMLALNRRSEFKIIK